MARLQQRMIAFAPLTILGALAVIAAAMSLQAPPEEDRVRRPAPPSHTWAEAQQRIVVANGGEFATELNASGGLRLSRYGRFSIERFATYEYVHRVEKKGRITLEFESRRVNTTHTYRRLLRPVADRCWFLSDGPLTDAAMFGSSIPAGVRVLLEATVGEDIASTSVVREARAPLETVARFLMIPRQVHPRIRKATVPIRIRLTPDGAPQGFEVDPGVVYRELGQRGKRRGWDTLPKVDEARFSFISLGATRAVLKPRDDELYGKYQSRGRCGRHQTGQVRPAVHDPVTDRPFGEL